MTDRVRHAVARTTGATTLAKKDGDVWRVLCLNHGASAEPTGSRSVAWKQSSHPQDWCLTCGTIAKGKAEKITAGRLDIPTTPKKAPAKKAAAPAKKPATKKAS